MLQRDLKKCHMFSHKYFAVFLSLTMTICNTDEFCMDVICFH